MMNATTTKLPPVVWQGIVKVQRSLSGSGEPQVMIYNREHTVELVAPADDILPWFEHGEYKFYAKAKLRGTIIHIIRKHYEPRSW